MRIYFEKERHYHIYNRGTDKREIFTDKYDVYRFIESIEEFNCVGVNNDIFHSERSRKRQIKRGGCPTPTKYEKSGQKLVNIIAYCLNPNHYHFILEELVEGGISEFMKRLNGGYSRYYNIKYGRSGSLFQGKFKAKYIKESLLYVSAYVNLNNLVHKKIDGTNSYFMDDIVNRSSWSEYIQENPKFEICEKDFLLSRYNTKLEYKKDAEEILNTIKEKRYED